MQATSYKQPTARKAQRVHLSFGKLVDQPVDLGVEIKASCCCRVSMRSTSVLSARSGAPQPSAYTFEVFSLTEVQRDLGQHSCSRSTDWTRGSNSNLQIELICDRRTDRQTHTDTQDQNAQVHLAGDCDLSQASTSFYCYNPSSRPMSSLETW